MVSQEKDDKQSRKFRITPMLIWLLIWSILIVWSGFNLWPESESRVSLPYSVFVQELKSDNVNSINIDGDKITGTFLNPVIWPRDAGNIKDAPQKRWYEIFLDESATGQYSEFLTIFPQEIGDPTLLSLLEEHNVTYNIKSVTGHWFVNLLLSWLPLVLLFMLIIWMTAGLPGGRSGVFSFGKSRPRLYISKKNEITFENVAGVDEAKDQLKQEVDFLRNPGKYHKIGARIPRGVLLVGPPGTGKTLLAKAVAGEASVPFFSISASEFVEMFVGVGASRVRDLFTQAKDSAPSIVFIDELDAVARRRGAGMGTVNDEREQTLNQLLVEMDGFDEREEVIILAATNRPDVLDPALLRPGRFDRQVILDFPDLKGREGILKIHSSKLKISGDVDLNLIARSTMGLSGSDLANLCNEAALAAVRSDRSEVGNKDFEEALDKIILGEKRRILLDQKQRKVIAYHEAGHAIVAWYTADADEVHKVTITPRGKALGVTEQLPGEEKYNYSRKYLEAKLDVLLGGRTAEEIVLGDVTTGAENDLINATQLARKMVTRWGMGNIGILAFKIDDEQPFLGYELARGKEYSEETAALIDREVKSLLDNTHDRVSKLLSSKREQLDDLAEALLIEETIDKEALSKIIGPRPKLEVMRNSAEVT